MILAVHMALCVQSFVGIIDVRILSSHIERINRKWMAKMFHDCFVEACWELIVFPLLHRLGWSRCIWTPNGIRKLWPLVSLMLMDEIVVEWDWVGLYSSYPYHFPNRMLFNDDLITWAIRVFPGSKWVFGAQKKICTVCFTMSPY